MSLTRFYPLHGCLQPQVCAESVLDLLTGFQTRLHHIPGISLPTDACLVSLPFEERGFPLC